MRLRAFFGTMVFDTMIHRNNRLAEAPSAGESIVTYIPSDRGAQEYQALAEEVVARLEAQHTALEKRNSEPSARLKAEGHNIRPIVLVVDKHVNQPHVERLQLVQRTCLTTRPPSGKVCPPGAIFLYSRSRM